jgi:hypothetical protein
MPAIDATLAIAPRRCERNVRHDDPHAPCDDHKASPTTLANPLCASMASRTV